MHGTCDHSYDQCHSNNAKVGRFLILCSSREYPYSPHRRDWNFLREGGSRRSKSIKKCMKLYQNFQRGGGGTDIFWNYTLSVMTNTRPPLLAQLRIYFSKMITAKWQCINLTKGSCKLRVDAGGKDWGHWKNLLEIRFAKETTCLLFSMFDFPQFIITFICCVKQMK